MAARQCTVCRHDDVTAVHEALIAGASIRRTAARFSLSATSVRRHIDRHLSAALRTEMENAGADGLELGDALSRLADIVNDLDDLRLSAVEAGDRTNAIRASVAAARTIATLTDRIGPDLGIARDLRLAQTFAWAVRDAAKRDPAVAELIAAGLRRRGEETAAQDVEALIAPTHSLTTGTS